MKKIDIPFGASDSEAYYEEIIIPEGLEAIMEDGRIILRKKETKDDKIIKAIIAHIKDLRCYDISYGVTPDEMVAWLEKQKSKPLVKSALDVIYEQMTDNANKVKPKFHEGDWVVISTSDSRKIVQVASIKYFKSGQPTYITSEGKWFGNGTKVHLWSIKDAKDGDVLVSEYNKPFIYNGKHISDSIGAHCGINIHDQFTVSITDYDWTDYDVKPATKEQSDFLFKEMREAGWEWDAEKKKLKKINWIKEFKKEWRNSNDNKR